MKKFTALMLIMASFLFLPQITLAKTSDAQITHLRGSVLNRHSPLRTYFRQESMLQKNRRLHSQYVAPRFSWYKTYLPDIERNASYSQFLRSLIVNGGTQTLGSRYNVLDSSSVERSRRPKYRCEAGIKIC